MADDPAGASPTCWFWPEGEGVRWWMPHATGLLPAEACATPALAADDDILSCPDRLWLLTTTLIEPLAELLADGFRVQPKPWRLALSDALPSSWQRLPFECLSYRGQRLDTLVQIIRHAPRIAEPPILPQTPEVIVVDQWPEAERGQNNGRPYFTGLLEGVAQGRILRGEHIQAQWPWLDLSMMALLCVIGHGSEGRAPQPFQVGPGCYWTLPLDQGLPPVVVLVACGDEQGNLLDYGRMLLAAGAQSVLAPVGRLDAAAADDFLRVFLKAWEARRTVSEALWAACQQPGSACGAGRMRLLGRGDVHRGPVRSYHEQDEVTLIQAAAADDTALLALLERITGHCFQTIGRLDEATTYLYDALHLDYDDSAAEEALLTRLHSTWPSLSALTRYWVTPHLVYLAEAYDHRLLAIYAQRRIELEAHSIGAPPMPVSHYSWAKLHYRQGRYGRMLEELANGFALLDEQRLTQTAGIGLLGLLLNGLIDLDLPQPGLALYDRLDACLSYADDPLSLLQNINRLDRRARLALRQGMPEQALIHYRCKHSLDVRDPEREQASLLYAAAWADPEEPEKYALAAAVRTVLQAAVPVLRNLGPGSETLAYLLRAYALWAWRTADEEAFVWLAEQLAAVNSYLSGRDPGPLGFALAYLHLAQCTLNDTATALPAWECAEAALEGAGYWLELAIFSALLGQGEKTARFLGQFQALRRESLATLEQLPPWLALSTPILWGEAIAQREQQEWGLLLGPSPPTVASLREAGILPL